MSKFRTNNSDLIQIPNQKVDERGTMFARMARIANSFAYKDYYKRHPELKKKDDHIRNMPPLMHQSTKYYDANYSEKARHLFDIIEDIKIDDEQITKYINQIDKNLLTDSIKKITLELGAVAVGCAKLEEKFIYSHKGRFDDNYGKKIELDHPNVIVFLVEMDFERMQSAPQAPTIYESANQYFRAAEISKYIAAIISKLGFESKAHYDAHYDVILPPLAVQAGLGEIGRNNILIADKFGSRVRIGAVTTNMPIDYDKPISIGAEKFCAVCKKCATNCPSRALSINGKSQVRGIQKWSTDVENCYSLWRKYGTDCGICMAVCPFSHRNNFLHNTIRKIVRYFRIFNKTLTIFDDLIYGKNWKVK